MTRPLDRQPARVRDERYRNQQRNVAMLNIA